MFWSIFLHSRREAAVKRLKRVVSEALAAREGAIATELHRADHMRDSNEKCALCVHEARRAELLKRLAS